MSIVQRFATEDHVEQSLNNYIEKDKLPEVINTAYTDYTLLARYDRLDKTTMPEAENFTLTFSESINNFAMIFLAVRSSTYVLGSAFIPVEFFKSGIQFELNCIKHFMGTYNMSQI